MQALLLALVVSSVFATPLAIDGPQPEHLQIHNDHILTLKVGIPGKWLRLRVRDDTSRIFLFQHPRTYSTTWESTPLVDEYGQQIVRDLVAIGSTHMHLNLVIGRFSAETSATVEGTQAEGVIGLAALSPLWIMWRNFTRSRDSLLLGHVLPRVSAVSATALAASLPPAWMYGSTVSLQSFVFEYSASLSAHVRASLQRNCLAALGEVVDEAVDLAGTSDTLAAVLGVKATDQLCQVEAEYRVLVAPEADYNFVPSVLLMHAHDDPPVFRLQSLVESSQSIKTVLFNHYEDMYLDLDSSSGGARAIPQTATRGRDGDEKIIVLGSHGLRRFELSYELDSERVYLSERHSGLSNSGERRPTVRSVEIRQIRDILPVIVGLLLWMLMAIEPDPTLPRHRGKDSVSYPHSQSVQSSPTIKPIMQQTGAGVLIIEVPPEPENLTSTRPAPLPKLAPVTELAAKNSTRVIIVLRTAFRLQYEWPVPVETMLFVQLLVELIVALYVVLSLAFYDTLWALTMVLDLDATTDSLGLVSLLIFLGIIVILSLLGGIVTGIDSRLTSLAIQLEILCGLYLLIVSLYQWDLALVLLMAITTIAGINLVVLLLSVWEVMPPYTLGRQTAIRRPLQGLTTVMVLSWMTYITLAVLPFIVSRLWDNDSTARVISTFLIAAIVFPIGGYLALQPYFYPLILSNTALQEIISTAHAHLKALTGTPG